MPTRLDGKQAEKPDRTCCLAATSLPLASLVGLRFLTAFPLTMAVELWDDHPVEIKSQEKNIRASFRTYFPRYVGQWIGAEWEETSAIPTSDISSKRGSNCFRLMPEVCRPASQLDEFNDSSELFNDTPATRKSALTSKPGAMPSAFPLWPKRSGYFSVFFNQSFASLLPGVRLASPVFFHPVPGTSNRFFLCCHQAGVFLWRMEKKGKAEEKSLFADLSHEVFYKPWAPNGFTPLGFGLLHPNV